MKFNEKLIELRKKEGLSQEELGYKLNVTRQTVSKWELGQTTPEMDKLAEIGKLFNVSVDELINDSAVTSDSNSNPNPIIEDQPIENKNPKKKNKLVIILIVVLVAIVIYIAANLFTAFAEFNTVAGSENGQANGFFERFFGLFDRVLDMQEEQIENLENGTSDIEDQISKSAFNMTLELNSGSNSGTTLKEVLDRVITSNKTNDKKITVKYNETETQDPEEIKNLKTKFKDTSDYEVSFDYDEEGYINKMTIEKVVSQFEISSFNSALELYAGSSNGMITTNVLDKIITSNKTEERKITVKYNGTETQDENEIKNIKRNFDTFDKCEITFEYDEDGFINKAIIEKL